MRLEEGNEANELLNSEGRRGSRRPFASQVADGSKKRLRVEGIPPFMLLTSEWDEMTDQLPATHGASWFAEWVTSGKIPGAVKAIARLVGASADVGTAWISIASTKGEQIQQSIKDETAAKTAVTKALAKAAASHAASDEGLAERAAEQWAGKRLRSQINREAVATRTIEHLEEGDTPADPTAAPTDDWLNIFEQYAEQASSEKIQDTWARVLAGEIRKPGSFSHRTLQILSILDQKLASILESMLSRVSNTKYIFIDEDNLRNEELEAFSVLQDVGLIRFSGLTCTMSTLNGPILHAVFRKNIVIGVFESEKSATFQTAILSPVSVELISIVNPKDDELQMKFIADIFRKQGAKSAGKIIIGPNGEPRYETFIEL